MKKLLAYVYNLLVVKIGADRIAHFGIGIVITMLCILGFSWFGIYPVVVNSLLLTFIAAKIKETMDEKKDNWDVIATMGGSIVMLGMFFFIKFAI